MRQEQRAATTGGPLQLCASADPARLPGDDGPSPADERGSRRSSAAVQYCRTDGQHRGFARGREAHLHDLLDGDVVSGHSGVGGVEEHAPHQPGVVRLDCLRGPRAVGALGEGRGAEGMRLRGKGGGGAFHRKSGGSEAAQTSGGVAAEQCAGGMQRRIAPGQGAEEALG